jgi:hypothetical protein
MVVVVNKEARPHVYSYLHGYFIFDFILFFDLNLVLYFILHGDGLG